MALVQPIKNGGPYTKKEQEERRLEVYHLYFEENYSAIKIAELLNVNRNTINEDIKFWNKQFTRDIKIHDLVSKMKTQIQRMEIQRSRLLEELDNDKAFVEKINFKAKTKVKYNLKAVVILTHLSGIYPQEFFYHLMKVEVW